MSEIKSYEFDALLKNRSLMERHIFVFYGTDKNLANDRIKSVLEELTSRLGDGYEIKHLNDSEITSHPDILFSEIDTISMFGDIKLIQCPLHKKIDQKRLTECAKLDFPHYLLLLASNLKKTHAFYKNLVNLKNCMFIPNYALSREDIGRYISTQLKERSLIANEHILLMLQELLANDLGLIRNELDKLALYMGNRKEISENDLVELLHVSYNPTLDDIVHSIALQNFTHALSLIDNALHGKTNVQTITIALTNHFYKLYQLVTSVPVKNTIALKTLIKKQRPPIHFSRHNDFIKECQLYRKSELVKILLDLQKLTIDMRTDSRLHHERLVRFILQSVGGRSYLKQL